MDSLLCVNIFYVENFTIQRPKLGNHLGKFLIRLYVWQTIVFDKVMTNLPTNIRLN